MSSSAAEAPPAGAAPGPRRLHPAAVVLGALDALREAVVPAIVLLVLSITGSGSPGGALVRAVVLALIAAVAAGIAGYVRWHTTTYRLEGGALHFRRGVFRVEETSVPLERVQSVDTVRGPVQRLFGVLELRVQAAGGGREPEIALRAVSPATAQELRGVLDEAAHRPLEADRPRAPAWRLRPGRLLVGALTAGQLGFLVPVVAGALQVLDDVIQAIGSPDRVGGDLLPDSLGEAALLLAAVAGAAWVLSIAGAVVAFAGFTVTRQGDMLRIRRGLLQRREATVPVARVHAVRIVENALRQPFRLVQLRAETAGYADEPAAAQTLFPLLARSEVRRFLDELLPELSDPLDRLERPPRRALRRYVAPPALAGLAAGAALAILTPAVGPAALLLAAPGAAYGALRHRDAGWRLEGDRLVLRSRRFARTTVVAAARRVEERSTSQSPLQRRARLASFGFAAGSGARFRVAHLEAVVARGLVDRLRPA